MNQPKTVDDWRAIITKERCYVDIRPYSHNIISTALRAIAELEGSEAANQAIDDYKLSKLGWQKRP